MYYEYSNGLTTYSDSSIVLYYTHSGLFNIITDSRIRTVDIKFVRDDGLKFKLFKAITISVGEYELKNII